MLKQFEKKIFQLLYVIREAKKCDKQLAQYPSDAETPEVQKLKKRHHEKEMLSRNLWVDIMMQIQDNNNGVQLFSNKGYFQVLEILQSMMCQISAESRTIVTIGIPMDSPRSDNEEEEEKDGLGGLRSSLSQEEEELSLQVETLKKEVEELSREVQLNNKNQQSKLWKHQKQSINDNQ